MYVRQQYPQIIGIHVLFLISDERVKSLAPYSRQPAIVPDNLHEKIGKRPDCLPMRERLKHGEDEPLPRAVSCGIDQDFTEIFLHVAGGKVTEPGIHPGHAGMPRVLYLPVHAFQYPVLLFTGESPDVTIQDHSEGIAIDNLRSTGLAVRREPGGKAPKFRNDTAVLTGHQGQHPPDGKAVANPLGEIPAGEEFGDLAVGRGDAAFSRSIEQPGSQHMTEGRLIAAGDLLQSKTLRAASITEQVVPRTPGEELEDTEPSGGVQQLGIGRSSAPLRHLMFDVVFVNKPPASQLERLRPCLRPGSTRNRLHEHQQTLRIRQQAVYPSLSGRGNELVCIFNAGIAAEKLADAVFGQGIEAQNPDLSPSRYALQVRPVVGSEPIRFPAGQPEPGAPESIQLGANGVQRGTAIRRSGPHLVEPVDEQHRVAPFGSVEERDEITRGDVAPPAAFSFLPEQLGLAGAGSAE